jgi:hypothetical protein
MTKQPTTEWTELAHRVNDGVDVMLVWVHGHGVDETLVSVYDTLQGSYFEIPAEPDWAFDVYNHPFAYLDAGDCEPSRLAA